MNNIIALNNNQQGIHIHPNVRTSFCPEVKVPTVDVTAYIHPLAAVIGNVRLGRRVMVAPATSVRGDEGQPMWIGDDVNIQDCVVVHALETHINGPLIREAVVEVDREFYGVHISERVSLAHQCQVHGPARIGYDTFVGMQSLVFRATVGNNCVIEPSALVMGVNVADGRYVPAGALITTQEQADKLPMITSNYPVKNLNNAVVHIKQELAIDYQQQEVQVQAFEAA